METLESAIHQRDLLADTICAIAERVGIKDPTVPADGPMALMLACDIDQYCIALLKQNHRQSVLLKQLGAGEEHF